METGENRNLIENISPNLQLIDKTFNREFSSGYHLSLILGLSGFAYCVFDLKQNRIIALEEVVFRKLPNYDMLCVQFKTFISQSSILSSSFKSVSVGIYNETATLVPSAILDESKKNQILQFNFSGEISSVANDLLQEIEINNVYDCPEIIVKTINEIYGKAKIVHFSSPLLESLSIENKHKSELKVYLHFFQKNQYGAQSRYEIIIFKNGKLLLFNSFYYQEKEDIAYYLLFVMEQLNINPENTTITMLGNIQKTDDAVVLIENYVRSVEFGNRPGNFEYSSVFDELPAHFYYGLLSQYLCV